MRKILTGLVAFVAMIIPFAGSAENRWSIYGGGSISHLCRQGRVFKGISNDGVEEPLSARPTTFVSTGIGAFLLSWN